MLFAVILSAVIWFTFQYIKKLRTKRTGEPVPEIREPAHIIAFRELEQLRAEKLWQNGEIKLYYTRLSEIVRQYLENRYGISALEHTTGETLDHLLSAGFKKDENYNKLRAVLTESDLVKFAKYKPGPVENDLNYETAWVFVDMTKKILPEEPENIVKNAEEEVER
jgi:hypothetical protein